jgi:acetyl esterase/lipase
MAITAEGAAIAVVDLTGAPEALLRRLFLTAVECLKRVVAWVVETADFLINDAAASAALALC